MMIQNAEPQITNMLEKAQKGGVGFFVFELVPKKSDVVEKAGRLQTWGRVMSSLAVPSFHFIQVCRRPPYHMYLYHYIFYLFKYIHAIVWLGFLTIYSQI